MLAGLERPSGERVVRPRRRRDDHAVDFVVQPDGLVRFKPVCPRKARLSEPPPLRTRSTMYFTWQSGSAEKLRIRFGPQYPQPSCGSVTGFEGLGVLVGTGPVYPTSWRPWRLSRAPPPSKRAANADGGRPPSLYPAVARRWP
jgi:hypothetical protein